MASFLEFYQHFVFFKLLLSIVFHFCVFIRLMLATEVVFIPQIFVYADSVISLIIARIDYLIKQQWGGGGDLGSITCFTGLLSSSSNAIMHG